MKAKAVIGEVTLQFNPEELPERIGVEYNQVGIKNIDVAPLDYKRGTGEIIEGMSFWLDGPTSGKGNSVESQIKTLKSYAKKDTATGAPPVVEFVYGDTLLPVVVTSCEVIDKKRDPDDASRTRALVTMSMQEFREHEYHRTPKEEKGDRIYITGSKSTLRSIALGLYQNGDLDRLIALRNPGIVLDMVGPILPAGREIVIPSWSVAELYIPETDYGGLVRYD